MATSTKRSRRSSIAHLRLQVRTHVLNDAPREMFYRWYFGMMSGEEPTQRTAQPPLCHGLGRRPYKRREVSMIVDVHAHYFPQEYTDLLMRIGGRSLPEAARPRTARPMRQDDPAGIQTRLQQMDEAGVQMQVLSPAASPPYADKEADAIAAARLLNDSYAHLVQQYPGRFAA